VVAHEARPIQMRHETYHLRFVYDFGTEELRIPVWVPNSVAEVAQREFQVPQCKTKTPDGKKFCEIRLDAKFLFRLTCDPRMRGVWRELSRQHRNGAFLHPATLGQDAAMAELFSTAVRCMNSPQTTMSRRQAKQRYQEFIGKANEWLAEAWVLLAEAVGRDGYSAKHGERLARIAGAADALREFAAENLAIEMRTALDRDRGEGQARWFALAIAEKCHALFGASLYGVSATITSVALNRSITPRTVRQWCARHPADKTPQNPALIRRLLKLFRRPHLSARAI
jgi:hypothetical protein